MIEYVTDVAYSRYVFTPPWGCLRWPVTPRESTGPLLRSDMKITADLPVEFWVPDTHEPHLRITSFTPGILKEVAASKIDK